MLTSLSEEANKAGLKLHPWKTKELSNTGLRKGPNAKKHLHRDLGTIDAATGHTEYLGRIVGFQDYHDREINHRNGKT